MNTPTTLATREKALMLFKVTYDEDDGMSREILGVFVTSDKYTAWAAVRQYLAEMEPTHLYCDTINRVWPQFKIEPINLVMSVPEIRPS